jgi:2-methylcitrate dehydratase PrpD
LPAERIIMSITTELARNIVETEFDAFDSSTVEKARMRIIDVVGCALGGATATGCSMLLDLMREWGGAGESTVLAFGDKLPVHHAAMVNSVFARSYDFEPTGALVEGKSTPSHISGTTVPAALSVAEAKGTSGKELLTAMILGDDLAARIAAASQLNIDSGWDSTGTVNVFGATAIAGKLWGLNARQMAAALGIGLNQMAGTFLNIFDYAHTFKLPQGLAAQAGIFSAALARKGFTGPKDPLTGKNGYFSLYCKTGKLDILANDLGRKFYAGDTFKPYPCCRSNHAAVECTLALVSTHSVSPEELEEIVVSVTPTAKNFAVGQPFRIGEAPQINAAFSLQYTVANAFLRKSMRLEHFTDPFIRDRLIMDVVKKIRLEATMQADTPLGAAVRIRTRQGKEYEARVDMPRGSDTLTPLTAAEKRDKFRNNVAFSQAVPMERAERALALLEKIEAVDDVAEITRLLSSG